MFQKEIEAAPYAKRRLSFLRKLKGSMAVFPSSLRHSRNSDVHFPYRQESTFYYFTGFEEPNSILLFAPQTKYPFQIFVQPKDKKEEMWSGVVLGPELAKHRLLADAAHPSKPETFFDNAFIEALETAENLYYRVGWDHDFDHRLFSLLARGRKKLGRNRTHLWPIIDPLEIAGEMRLIKNKAEIERLERATHISAEAHVNAMRITKPGIYEYEVEAALFHSFRGGGAGRVSYNPIVAGGTNACVLHYTSNDCRLNEKDLLLVDAGAEFDYYAADITRVWPVGGAFSKEQREVYGAVLTAQKRAIGAVRPGRTLVEIHTLAVEILVEELKRLKVLRGPTRNLIKKKEYFQYYPHNTSHWLGMDVHDVGEYVTPDSHRFRRLEPGMVFTIEPGLYLAPDSQAPARYKGIGVRIEDDIVVTPTGYKVLTSGAPKEIEEIESLCNQV